MARLQTLRSPAKEVLPPSFPTAVPLWHFYSGSLVLPITSLEGKAKSEDALELPVQCECCIVRYNFLCCIMLCLA